MLLGQKLAEVEAAWMLAQKTRRTLSTRSQSSPKLLAESTTGGQDVVLPPESQPRLPWVSTISLMYPAGAMIYAAWLGAPFVVVIGYGIANLGYILLGAGVFAGTYKLLHLNKRWHVLACGLIAFGIGTLLCNFD
jgi:hypothetical protein